LERMESSFLQNRFELTFDGEFLLMNESERRRIWRNYIWRKGSSLILFQMLPFPIPQHVTYVNERLEMVLDQSIRRILSKGPPSNSRRGVRNPSHVRQERHSLHIWRNCEELLSLQSAASRKSVARELAFAFILDSSVENPFSTFFWQKQGRREARPHAQTALRWEGRDGLARSCVRRARFREKIWRRFHLKFRERSRAARQIRAVENTWADKQTDKLLISLHF